MRRLILKLIGGYRERNGFALIVTTVLLGIVLTISVTLLDISLNTRRTSKYVEQTATAVMIAESGLHKAIYCVKATSGGNCGGSYGASYTGESNTAFGGGTFTVSVTGAGSVKTLVATGTTASGVTQTIRTQISIDAPSQSQPGFDYAVQAGDLGVQVESNAEINDGVVYTNSDVICGNNAEVNYDIFVSKVGGMIDNCDGVVDAHADKILHSHVVGDAYYKNNPADILGTTVAGTKFANQATPAPLTMPVFDRVFWETVAESGGVLYGDQHPADGAVLGPVKIVGDLTLDNNVHVTVNGPIWVVGDITTTNNSSFALAVGFGPSSGVIIADDQADTANSGLIHIVNNSFIVGSGSDGSYIMMYTSNTRTSDTSPAIMVENNAAGGIFFAPNGSIRINQNGSAVAAVARRVYLDNNAVINYDNTGATPSNMSIAMVAGGIWRFLQGVWQQYK